MQKIITLLVLCLLSGTTFSQTPFTITADNFPVWGLQVLDGPSNLTAPKIIPAANGNWDYSSYHSGGTGVNNYIVETDPFYTNAGTDVYISSVKTLVGNLGYQVFYEYDFNNTGVYENGIYVDPHGFDLNAYTGNILDSITFPLQGSIFAVGRQVIAFPATYQTAWHSESHRTVDFNLTVNALGLNKVPFKHVFTVFRSDSIVGWGKLRVYANGIPSIPYDVLIDRSTQYAVDSFYTGGAPAPANLLSAFGMTQGQQTGRIYRHTVYREGNSTPFAMFSYNAANFNTLTSVFFDTQNLSTSAVNSLAHENYSTLLFPNPSPTGFINLQITGEMPDVDRYSVTDQQGRLVQTGAANMAGDIFQLQLNSDIPAGQYILQLIDRRGRTVITEQLTHGR